MAAEKRKQKTGIFDTHATGQGQWTFFFSVPSALSLPTTPACHLSPAFGPHPTRTHTVLALPTTPTFPDSSRFTLQGVLACRGIACCRACLAALHPSFLQFPSLCSGRRTDCLPFHILQCLCNHAFDRLDICLSTNISIHFPSTYHHHLVDIYFICLAFPPWCLGQFGSLVL